MREKFIEELGQSFGEIKFSSIMRDWCLISINPLPPEDEILTVICDTQNNLPFNIEEGKIRHLDTCVKKSHPVDKRIIDSVNLLKDDTFKIAICMQEEAPPLNQPIAISLDPLISLTEYPDHMHINAPLTTSSLEQIGLDCLWESLCYNKDARELGNSIEERVMEAMGMITMWAFKQQIWLASRELYGMGKGIWIGKHTPYFEKPGSYFYLLNPKNKCRCGSNKLYRDCCMQEDAKAYRNENPHIKKIHNWERDVSEPRNNMIRKLKKAFDIAQTVSERAPKN